MSIGAGNSGVGGVLQMDEVRVDPMIALRVPANLAMRREMLPFSEWQGRVHVACSDPRDGTTLGIFQRAFDAPVHPCAAEPESLRRALQKI